MTCKQYHIFDCAVDNDIFVVLSPWNPNNNISFQKKETSGANIKMERQQSLRLRSKGKKLDEGKKSKKSKKGNKSKPSTSEVTASTPSSIASSYDGFAWLALFVPSLVYYLFIRASSISANGGTIRRGIFSHGTNYMQISATVECSFPKCDGVSELLPLSTSASSSDLSQPMQEVLSNTAEQPAIFHHLNHPLWVHDEELGRGFLLISDMATNRIWRWETGGGPIPIGRTLHMERSGCRSNRTQCDLWSQSSSCNDDKKPKIGSAGIAMTTTLPGTVEIEPKLIVSEIGEQRIIRIEEDGARTPLVKPVQAWDLVYLPTFHDLLFISMESSRRNQLFALRNVNSIPPILSSQSRSMHSVHETKHEDGELDIIYDGQSSKSQLMALSLANDFRSVFVLERTKDSKVLVVNVMLEEEEEEEEDVDDEDEEGETKEDEDEEDEEYASICKSNIFFDITSLLPKNSKLSSPVPNGGMQVDTNGNIYIAIHPIGIVILNSIGVHVGTIPITNPQSSSSHPSEEIITSLAFGEDDYLYISTTTRLLRMKLHSNTKGMTMNVIKNSGETPNKWASRCSSIIP